MYVKRCLSIVLALWPISCKQLPSHTSESLGEPAGTQAPQLPEIQLATITKGLMRLKIEFETKTGTFKHLQAEVVNKIPPEALTISDIQLEWATLQNASLPLVRFHSAAETMYTEFKFCQTSHCVSDVTRIGSFLFIETKTLKPNTATILSLRGCVEPEYSTSPTDPCGPWVSYDAIQFLHPPIGPLATALHAVATSRKAIKLKAWNMHTAIREYLSNQSPQAEEVELQEAYQNLQTSLLAGAHQLGDEWTSEVESKWLDPKELDAFLETETAADKKQALQASSPEGLHLTMGLLQDLCFTRSDYKKRSTVNRCWIDNHTASSMTKWMVVKKQFPWYWEGDYLCDSAHCAMAVGCVLDIEVSRFLLGKSDHQCIGKLTETVLTHAGSILLGVGGATSVAAGMALKYPNARPQQLKTNYLWGGALVGGAAALSGIIMLIKSQGYLVELGTEAYQKLRITLQKEHEGVLKNQSELALHIQALSSLLP